MSQTHAPDPDTTAVDADESSAHSADAEQEIATTPAPAEVGGRGGLDPTRYGDWEKNGRCIDF